MLPKPKASWLLIEDGVRLDNLCMIAHNVHVGAHTAMAAMTGIAGSTKIGKRCMFAGRSGAVGHLTICDDVVVAAEGTAFGLTETKLGLIPATIGPYVIARMGEAKARSVFYSSKLFAVDEALQLGLVNRVVAADALDKAVEEEVLPYLSCAPGAVAEAKALIREVSNPIPAGAIEASVDALVRRWASPEADEGTRAFFEKRKANWTR